MEIYIKPKRKVSLLNRDEILISDIADIVAPASNEKKINNLKLTSIESGKKDYLISVTDIIKKINKEYPDAVIRNVGEMDTWVHIAKRKKHSKPSFLWLRVIFVSVVLFVGASTAIMSFHTDSQIPKIFQNYHYMFFGTKPDNTPIITIPYAIGLAVGIMVFYNHFMGKKFTDDLTPIEVEIETYEKEVTESMIAMLDRDDELNA